MKLGVRQQLIYDTLKKAGAVSIPVLAEIVQLEERIVKNTMSELFHAGKVKQTSTGFYYTGKKPSAPELSILEKRS